MWMSSKLKSKTLVTWLYYPYCWLRTHSGHLSLMLSIRHLFVWSQQWKHQNNVWNLFKVINRDTRIISVTSLWCLYCWLWTYFTHSSVVSIVDTDKPVSVGLLSTLEQLMTCWKVRKGNLHVRQIVS